MDIPLAQEVVINRRSQSNLAESVDSSAGSSTKTGLASTGSHTSRNAAKRARRRANLRVHQATTAHSASFDSNDTSPQRTDQVNRSVVLASQEAEEHRNRLVATLTDTSKSGLSPRTTTSSDVTIIDSVRDKHAFGFPPPRVPSSHEFVSAVLAGKFDTYDISPREKTIPTPPFQRRATITTAPETFIPNQPEESYRRSIVSPSSGDIQEGSTRPRRQRSRSQSPTGSSHPHILPGQPDAVKNRRSIDDRHYHRTAEDGAVAALRLQEDAAKQTSKPRTGHSFDKTSRSPSIDPSREGDHSSWTRLPLLGGQDRRRQDPSPRMESLPHGRLSPTRRSEFDRVENVSTGVRPAQGLQEPGRYLQMGQQRQPFGNSFSAIGPLYIVKPVCSGVGGPNCKI